MTRAHIGAWAGLGCLQFFLCEQLARLGWPGHYSLRTNYISDLGASSLCAAHALMNASFLAQSILIAAAALLLPFGSAVFAWLARVLLLFAALGILTVAVYPEDRNMNIHLGGAAVHFLAGTLAMLLAAVALLPRRRELGVRWRILVTLLFASIAAAGDLLLAPRYAALQASWGLGLVERLAAYPLPLWLAFSGAYSLLRPPPARGLRYSGKDA